LTKAEFAATYLGFKPELEQDNEETAVFTGSGDVANDIDWVTKGAVTGVKD